MIRSTFYIFIIFPLVFAEYFSFYSSKNSKFEHKKGDLNIGFLFPLHRRMKSQKNYCSKNFRVVSYYDAITAKMAIRAVNEDDTILSGVELGYSILDDCDNFLTVIGESLLFLPKQRFEANAVIGPYSSTQSKAVTNFFCLSNFYCH